MNTNSLKRKKIGVLMGGLSREREISLRTGTAIARALTEKGYQIVPIDVGQDVAEILLREKVACAFIALHGRYGEDGTIQGMLELMGIPYTGSGVLASALAMHKIMTKKVLACEKIPTPAFEVYHKSDLARGEIREVPFPFPLVVKPAREGSTIGISVVKTKEAFLPALKDATDYDEEVLVEAFVEGREITVAILDGLPLPIIEIVPRSGFYDYHSKYTKGETEYIIPARIPEGKYREAQELAVRTYRILGCSGCARIDLMTDREANGFIIDVNTMPGMTETSLVPQAAAHADIPFADLAERILLGASLKLR